MSTYPTLRTLLTKSNSRAKSPAHIERREEAEILCEIFDWFERLEAESK